MRPFNVKLLCGIGLLIVIGLVVVTGCGSGGDLLDEPGTRYSAYAVPQDNEEDTQEIDVWQGLCGTDPEPFLPFDVKVIVTADSSAADFYVESYDVRFRRNEGTYCEEVTPGCNYVDLAGSDLPDLTGTVLNPRQFSYTSPVIKKNSSMTLDGMLVWTQGDKVFYGSSVLWDFGLDEEITDSLGAGIGVYENQTADFTYDMQIVLHCKTVGNEDFTITTPWTPIHFADFDNC